MTLSGPAWVHQFSTSSSVNDLQQPFRGNVISFLGALAAAGAIVTIADTLRPPERVYLMHWSFFNSEWHSKSGKGSAHEWCGHPVGAH
jgi:hypothetical protein